MYAEIDLAKNVFAVHRVNAVGHPALVQRSVPRATLLELIVSLPPCTGGVGACSGARHWARLFAARCQHVRLMAPEPIAAYRLSGKRAKHDAAAM